MLNEADRRKLLCVKYYVIIAGVVKRHGVRWIFPCPSIIICGCIIRHLVSPY